MSYVVAAPDALAAVASNVADMGSTIKSATTAAADEVSTQIAALFSTHGLEFQQPSAQAAAFHEQFVQTLTASANAYTAAETSIAQTLSGSAISPAAIPNTAAAGPYLPYLPYTGIGLLDRLIFGINSLLYQIDLLAFRFILS